MNPVGAVHALHAQLQQINGAGGGYHYDLTDRVRWGFKEPTDVREIFTPYLCVQHASEPANVEDGTQQCGSRVTETIPVVGYVKDPATQNRETEAILPVRRLLSDVWRALTDNMTLGGAVEYWQIRTFRITAGVLSDAPYAELWVPVQITYSFDRNDLGVQA